MEFTLNKGLVKPWLRKLTRNGILVGPVKLEGGDVIYKELFSTKHILLEYKKPLYSAKAFLLPQEETMFTFEGRSVSSIQEKLDDLPRVFFGIRPCDLKAIVQADRFFTENYRDPFYTSRREKALVITIGCNKPESDCFCHTMGLGPHYKEGADLFLVDLGSCFLVEPLTPKGVESVQNYAYYFETSSPGLDSEVSAVKQKAVELLEANIPAMDATSLHGSINGEFLKTIANKCASCGSCSYVCPMCFCYNVVDRPNREMEGKRVRTWDSCIFEGFTRMAGRHNLLKSREHRLQKRFDHKLKHYPETYGIPGCTGCGRCSATCLGHISMLDIIRQLTGEVF